MPSPIDITRHDRIRPLRWTGRALEVLDQRKLPFVEETLCCDDSDSVANAIAVLAVRGAPAIGIAAAWGVVLAAQSIEVENGRAAAAALAPAIARLAAARPTAVNLAWALQQMQAALAHAGTDWRQALYRRAQQIADQDLAANRRMGMLGAAAIAAGSGVLTHCNTGSLATSGFGTALGVIRTGVAQRRIARVFACETRPWLQGARLTAWELRQDGIDVTLIADSAAAHLMKSGRVQWVVVGADRICANGDIANKIGTSQLAILARHYGVRFMVVAPASTIDMDTAAGDAIQIEERAPEELLSVAGQRIVAAGVRAWNPVFDVTTHDLIDLIVTERGVLERPDPERMRQCFGGGATPPS